MLPDLKAGLDAAGIEFRELHRSRWVIGEDLRGIVEAASDEQGQLYWGSQDGNGCYWCRPIRWEPGAAEPRLEIFC